MRCPNCGFDSPRGMEFCGMCGTCLSEEPSPTQPLQPQPPPAAQPSPSPMQLEGERRLATVILADMRSVDELRKAKQGVYTIGDALIPRRGNSAILDGYKMGMRL